MKVELAAEISFQEEEGDGTPCAHCGDMTFGQRCLRLYMRPRPGHVNAPFQPLATVTCSSCSEALREKLADEP